MKGPIDRDRIKAAWRSGAGERGDAVKALSRIEYFEAQRGLPRTQWQQGIPRPESVGAPRVVRKKVAKVRSRPQALYAKATQQRGALRPSFPESVGLPVWRQMGPSLIPQGQTYGSGGNNRPPVSGRCVGIVVSPSDPANLVLCSAGGGLWRSRNQGATWEPLTDQQPTLSMGAIAAAPSSPNMLYAGTGEGDTVSQLGAGLLRSADGGQTWEILPADELADLGIYDIQVHPTDPLNVWVGTTRSVLESRSGGRSWRRAQPVTGWSISLNPTEPQELFVATAAGLIRSGNGGATWSRVALPGAANSSRFRRLEVQHAPSRPGVVYVTAVFSQGGAGPWRVGFWRRPSASASFTSQPPPPLKPGSDVAQSWYDWCLGVSPADPDLVFWGAVELYRGKRSGSSWTWRKISSRSHGESIHPDQHHIAFDPSDPQVVYICNDGGLFRSPNNGKNWTALNPGLDITEFEFIIHLESEDTWLIGGTQDNGTLANATSGRWDQIALGDGGDCAADEAKMLCYHSYYGMWIERAAALGSNAFEWTDVSPPIPADYSALFYPPMDMESGILAKAGETLFVSEDSGASWEEVDFGGAGQNASAVTIVDRETILVGGEHGALARVERASAGWQSATVVPLTSPRAGFVSDILAPGAVNRVLWMSCSAFGGGHVFRSLNGGKTWEDKSGNLPDIPVNALVIDPTNTRHVYAATDHGVYRSRNAGAKWADFSNGLPNVVVGDMILHERQRLLRIGTRSRGAWEVEI